MVVSPGGPYRNGYPPYYAVAYEEHRRIRSTANGVCWTVLIGILLMFALSDVCMGYLRIAGYRPSPEAFGGIPPVLYYLLVSVEYSVGLALPAFLYFAFRRMPLAEGLPFRKTGAADVVLFVSFGCMVCMLANYPANLVSAIQESFGFGGSLPEMPLNDDPRVLVLYAVNVVVIPPLVEEILFRGVALQSLRKYGDGFAVLVSAVLFGLYHGNFIQMVFAFLCGLAMGFVVIRTGSLLPSILVHFVNNSISLAIEMVSRYSGQAAANETNNILSVAVIALGAVSTAVLAARGKLFAGRRGSVLPLSSRMRAAFGNPGAVFLALYAFGSSLYTLYRS